MSGSDSGAVRMSARALKVAEMKAERLKEEAEKERKLEMQREQRRQKMLQTKREKEKRLKEIARKKREEKKAMAEKKKRAQKQLKKEKEKEKRAKAKAKKEKAKAKGENAKKEKKPKEKPIEIKFPIPDEELSKAPKRKPPLPPKPQLDSDVGAAHETFGDILLVWDLLYQLKKQGLLLDSSRAVGNSLTKVVRSIEDFLAETGYQEAPEASSPASESSGTGSQPSKRQRVERSEENHVKFAPVSNWKEESIIPFRPSETSMEMIIAALKGTSWRAMRLLTGIHIAFLRLVLEDQEAHEVAEESSDEESEEEDEGSDAEEGLIAATSGSNAFSKPQLSFLSPVTWLEVFRLWLKEAVVEGTEPLEAEAKSVLHELHNTDYHGLSFNNKVQVLRILCNGVMRTHTLAHVFDVKSQEVKKILKEKAKHDQEESSREKELKKIQKSYEQEMKAWEDDFNKKKWEIWQNTGVFNQPAAVKEDDSSSESDSDTSIGTQQQNIDEYTWEVAEAEGLTKSQYRRELVARKTRLEKAIAKAEASDGKPKISKQEKRIANVVAEQRNEIARELYHAIQQKDIRALRDSIRLAKESGFEHGRGANKVADPELQAAESMLSILEREEEDRRGLEFESQKHAKKEREFQRRLLHASIHGMCLGEDAAFRKYWVFPANPGAIFVQQRELNTAEAAQSAKEAQEKEEIHLTQRAAQRERERTLAEADLEVENVCDGWRMVVRESMKAPVKATKPKQKKEAEDKASENVEDKENKESKEEEKAEGKEPVKGPAAEPAKGGKQGAKPTKKKGEGKKAKIQVTAEDIVEMKKSLQENEREHYTAAVHKTTYYDDAHWNEKWAAIKYQEDLLGMIAALDDRGIRERELKKSLEDRLEILTKNMDSKPVEEEPKAQEGSGESKEEKEEEDTDMDEAPRRSGRKRTQRAQFNVQLEVQRPQRVTRRAAKLDDAHEPTCLDHLPQLSALVVCLRSQLLRAERRVYWTLRRRRGWYLSSLLRSSNEEVEDTWRFVQQQPDAKQRNQEIRSDWVSRVETATTVAEFRQLILDLESALYALQKSHRQHRRLQERKRKAANPKKEEEDTDMEGGAEEKEESDSESVVTYSGSSDEEDAGFGGFSQDSIPGQDGDEGSSLGSGEDAEEEEVEEEGKFALWKFRSLRKNWRRIALHSRTIAALSLCLLQLEDTAGVAKFGVMPHVLPHSSALEVPLSDSEIDDIASDAESEPLSSSEDSGEEEEEEEVAPRRSTRAKR